jgi:hypothetical protein
MTISTTPLTICQWHAYVKSLDVSALADLLDEHCTFQSPVGFKPQLGRAITTRYLTAAMQVLGNGSFVYQREWYADGSAVLEFESTVEGVLVNGVDLITWNAANKITDFKVMVRPLKAVNKLHEMMARTLSSIG